MTADYGASSSLMTDPTEPDTAADLTVSDVIADVVTERAPASFGVMGNGNAFFVSRLTRRSHRYVKARHEAGALAMAVGMSMAGGGTAVATTTYGPGFTNLLTPLAEASLAGVACVVVAGDAPGTRRRFDVDQVSLATTLGAHVVVVDASTALRQTHEAFDIAERLRRPVVLLLPYDLSDSPAPHQEPRQPMLVETTVREPASEDVEGVAELLASAERPLLILGRGGWDAGAAPAVKALGDALGGLFATSVLARNAFGSPWDLGIAGGFNTVAAADLMRQADVVLVFGASLDYNQTRYDTLFTGARAVVQVDVAEGATSPLVTRFVRADARAVAEALLERLIERTDGRWRDSVEGVDDGRVRTLAGVPELAADGLLDPRAVTIAVDAMLPAKRTIVQDGGHNIVWMNALARVPEPQAMLNSGLSFLSIGMGFPYAVGAAMARPDDLLLAICGDGGGMMTLPELETLIREVPRCVVLAYNDSAYAMEIHQYVPRGLDDAGMVFPELRFADIARAMGAHAVTARRLADLDQLGAWLESGGTGTFFVDALVSPAVVGEYVTEKLAIEQAQLP